MAVKARQRKTKTGEPIEIQRGSSVVKIRYSPLIVKGKTYPSFLLDYYVNGKRHRDRRKTEREARALADAVLSKLVKGEIEALEMTGEDRRIYLLAVENLEKLDIHLDAATREYADAKGIAGNADLRDVARFYKQYGAQELKREKVPELVKLMLADLARDKRGDYHIRDLDVRLGRFSEAFPGYIDEIKTGMIDDWLGALVSNAKHGEGKGKPVRGRTRNNYRNSVVELFNFAKEHNYLPKGMPTEAEATKTVSEEDSRENEIFKLGDMVRLLNEAKLILIPSMVIKAFSGVRTEEISEMEWGHVAFKRGCIILPKSITKKKRRRIIPILPNLRMWLEPFEGLTGRICSNWSTPQTVFQAWDRIAKILGISAGANRFRNSYISYRVAQTQDIGKTALESGNSAKVIQENYLELATEEEGEQWFNICPSKDKIAALITFAAELRQNPSILDELESKEG
jgi:integrase